MKKMENEFTPKPFSFEERRTELKEGVTIKRRTVETGGVTLPDGTAILTGIEDQNRIATTIQGMRDSGIMAVNFKAASGWTTLTLDQLVVVSNAVAAHVEACFSRERALHEAIDACTDLRELGNIDIAAGWPGDVA